MSGADEPNNHNPEGGDKELDSEQRYTQEEAAWTETISPKDGKGNANGPQPPSEKPKRDWLDYANLAVMYLTFFAALAAAIFAGLLASFTQDALSDARLSAQTSHDDTIRAENLTADSLGLARESANAAAAMARATTQSASNYVRVERGQFIADSMQLTGLKQTPDQKGFITLGVTFSFTNFGRSPVRMVDYVLMMNVGKLPPHPKYSAPEETLYALAPGGNWHSVKSFTGAKITVQQATEIIHDTLPVFLYGWIRYRDTFGKVRKTCFAYQFVLEDNDASVRFGPGGPNAYWCDE